MYILHVIDTITKLADIDTLITVLITTFIQKRCRLNKYTYN